MRFLVIILFSPEKSGVKTAAPDVLIPERYSLLPVTANYMYLPVSEIISSRIAALSFESSILLLMST